MPFVMRRVSDGKYYRRSSSSRPKMVDKLEDATSWPSKGNPKSVLHNCDLITDGDEVEIVETQTVPVRVVEVIKVGRKDPSSTVYSKRVLKVEKPRAGGFRVVDEDVFDGDS